MSRRPLVTGLFAASLLAAAVSNAAEGDITFDIAKFQVEGNSLIPEGQLNEIVAPFIGPRKVYGDIQRALEALEGSYRAMGYGTVQVYAPEQEVASGVVRLVVTEAVVGKVIITGNQHFSAENIRASLPLLKEGTAPNMRKLSENVQLANESPAKQVEVTLGVSEDEAKVDAKVNVTDSDPQKVSITLDNTGTGATGKHRIGFAYQNANVGDIDQVLTLAYTTSPDKPSGVGMDVYSVAYRLPIYALGDSIDIIYGNSNVSTPMTTAGPGTATLNGKGEVVGLRYNHIFPRQGEYTSRLVLGFDYKHMNTRCTNPVTGASFGVTVGDQVADFNAACTPHTLRPLSATYAGQWMKPGMAIDFNIGVSYNWGMGVRYATLLNTNDYYTVINSGRQTPDNFMAVRLGGSYMAALPADWQLRIAANGQYTPAPIVAAEQFGLVGSTAVRGFNERAVSTDVGWVGNIEAYSPELAGTVGAAGSLRGVMFYDFARGYSYNVVRTVANYDKAGVAAIGVGLRYTLDKQFSAKFDLANVIDAGPVDIPGSASNTEGRGDWRAHFNMMYSF